ncbi:MAG: fimbrillin family protein [Rikenellaceae bacterium]
MNNIKRFSTLIAALTCVACNSGDDFESEPSQLEPKSICVVTSTTTRAITAFDTSKSFYLYIDQTGDGYDYFVKMENENGEWIAKSIDDDQTVDMEMIDAAADIKISALYGESLTSTLDDYTSELSVYTTDEDLLYANIDESTLTISTEGVIEITFTHLFSSLAVTVTTSETFVGATLKGIVQTFTWAASEGSDAIVLDSDSTTSIDLTSGEELYIVPQEVSTLAFNIELTSGSYSSVISQTIIFGAAESRTLTIEAGSQTPLVTLDGVTTSEWVDENGEFEFEMEE